MLVPLSWLREFVELPANPADLIDRLALAGLESSGVKVVGFPVPSGLRVKPGDATPVWDRDKLIVARVLKIEKHPNADKLKLVTLDYGHTEPKTVVTGAPNIAPGQSGMKVILGLRGSTYYLQAKDGTKTIATLEPKELRGVPNDAMCMSNYELGIADDHDGIIILDESDPVPGTPLQDFLGEIVVELDVLPNMARCLAVREIGREVAALTGRSFCDVKPSAPPSGTSVLGSVAIQIEDPKLCPRYSASIIDTIHVGPAPGWMRRRLHYAGLRPINNVVDVTNYVMLELGQPLHAFDYDVLVKRAGGKPPTIGVRPAKTGEVLKTLDGQVRELTTDDLLICDSNGPIALAGVMGGFETEVTEATRTILLESASFDFVSVRKTARKFNLFSEASGRFSRGVHPEIVPLAATRACELLALHAGGKVRDGLVDSYPLPVITEPLDLTRREIERLLGTSIPDAEVERVLSALGFSLEETPWGWKVTPPATRLDIQDGPADLIEEIARMAGYNHLPERLAAFELPVPTGHQQLAIEEQIRDLLADCGLSEAITYSFASGSHESKLKQFEEPPVELLNPTSPERSTLRRSLIPGLLDVIHRNLQSADRAAMFEIGPIFIAVPGRLPDEPRRLAIAMTGRAREAAWDDDQASSPKPFDFFDLKGIVESLMTGLNLPDPAYAKAADAAYLHPGKSADVSVNGTRIGTFGELHPAAATKFDLSGRSILIGEFDLDRIVNLVPERWAYRPFGTFPPAKRDLAIVVPVDTPAKTVLDEIRAGGGSLLASAELFDLYTGDRIPAGMKSLAYALSYQAPDRTLSDKEIDAAHLKIEGRLKHRLMATVRGKE